MFRLIFAAALTVGMGLGNSALAHHHHRCCPIVACDCQCQLLPCTPVSSCITPSPAIASSSCAAPPPTGVPSGQVTPPGPPGASEAPAPSPPEDPAATWTPEDQRRFDELTRGASPSARDEYLKLLKQDSRGARDREFEELKRELQGNRSGASLNLKPAPTERISKDEPAATVVPCQHGFRTLDLLVVPATVASAVR